MATSLRAHIERAKGRAGWRAAVTMPLSQQIHKAHKNVAARQAGSQARSQSELLLPKANRECHVDLPALSHALSRSLPRTVSLSLSTHSFSLSLFCFRLASLNCVQRDLCYSCHFLTLTLPIYMRPARPGPARPSPALPTLRQISIQCGRN